MLVPTLIDPFSSESSLLVVSPELDRLDSLVLGSISAKALVVEQNRKLPKILPWGEPPGTVLGAENVSLIFTNINIPCKKAATQSIEVSSAPRSDNAVKQQT